MANPSPVKMNPAGELREKLEDAMTDNIRPYIPNDMLEQLIGYDTIERVVKDPSSMLYKEGEGFVAKLCRDCRILVAIFVQGRLCENLLKALVQHGYTDQSLPLSSDCPKWLMENGHQKQYRRLYRNQWRFKAAVFDKADPQTFPDDIIIPYLKKIQQGKGGFGTVYKVLIEPSHQRVYSLPGDKNPYLALKVVARSTTVQNERLMLEALQGVRNNHIIRLLGTYEKGENYHFLFPFADGDLLWLIEQGPDLRRSKAFVPWITAQMKGICDALCIVHKQTEVTTALLDLRIQERATGHLYPSYQQGTGYHHDIKLQNILYFPQSRIVLDQSTCKSIPELGMLQLADFGVGKFRRVQSGSGTTTWRGTPTYAAPESLPENLKMFTALGSKQKISRPYDIWSFGCVLLEILVWIIHGRDELRAFRARRLQPVYEGITEFKTDAFFYMTEPTLTEPRQPKLKDEVVRCMQKLNEHVHLRNPDSSLSVLLKLIERTLQINPMDRMEAQDLTTKLSTLSKLAEIEPPYELTDGVTSPIEASIYSTPKSKSYPSISTVEIRVQPPSG